MRVRARLVARLYPWEAPHPCLRCDCPYDWRSGLGGVCCACLIATDPGPDAAAGSHRYDPQADGFTLLPLETRREHQRRAQEGREGGDDD